jgi:hypothetical protein
MIDAAIPLAGQPIKVDNPLDSYSKLMGIANAGQEMALRGQEFKEKQADFRDQQIMTQAYQQAQGDIAKTRDLAVQMGARQKAIQAWDGHIADQKKKAADTDEQQLRMQQQKNAAVGAAAQSILQMPDEQTRAQAWPQVRDQLVQQGILSPQQAQQFQNYPGAPVLQNYANISRSSQQIYEGAQKEQEQKTRAQEIASQNADRQAKLDHDEAARFTQALTSGKGPTLNQWNAAYQKLSPGAKAIVDSFVPPKPNAQSIFDLDAPNNDNLDKLRHAFVPVNDQIRNEQKSSEDEETKRYHTGELSVRGQQLALEKEKFNEDRQTIDPLVPVAPRSRNQAAKAYENVARDYNKAQQRFRTMQTFIDEMRQGNKAAAASIDPQGVITLNTSQGITRVNKSELDSMKGGGNLYDKLAGSIKKAATGVGKSDSVINDTEQLFRVLRDNSDQSYSEGVHSVNNAYGSRYAEKPESSQSGSTGGTVPPAVAAGGTVIVKDSAGKLYKIPSGQPIPQGYTVAGHVNPDGTVVK